VEHAAQLAIERAKAHRPGRTNLTWGTFVQDSVRAAPKGSPTIGANVQMGQSVRETNDLGATGAPQPSAKKSTSKKASGAPTPEPPTGEVSASEQSAAKKAAAPKADSTTAATKKPAAPKAPAAKKAAPKKKE
jgi:hypothetical protein